MPQMFQRDMRSRFVEALNFTWISSRPSVACRNSTSMKRADRHIDKTNLTNTIYIYIWEVISSIILQSMYLLKYQPYWVTHHSEDFILCNNLILSVDWHASCDRLSFGNKLPLLLSFWSISFTNSARVFSVNVCRSVGNIFFFSTSNNLYNYGLLRY